MKKFETKMSGAEPVNVAGLSMLTVSVRTIRRIGISTADSGGSSFGELIDRHLADSAMNGDTVESFQLEIYPEQWEEFCARIKQAHAE